LFEHLIIILLLESLMANTMASMRAPMITKISSRLGEKFILIAQNYKAVLLLR